MIPLKDDNPTSIFPYVTITFIVANVLIFFYQFSLGEGLNIFIYNFGAVPYLITNPQEAPPEIYTPAYLTLFTSMFLHGGWMHLIGNMLYLWIFGNNIEDQLGHIGFIVFYLGCGLLATAAHIMTDPSSKIPTVGASGAISGVLGAYLIRFPRARVLTLIWFGFFVRMVHLPALVFLGFWIMLQLLYGLPTLGGQTGGGVAYFAHIGGFAAGVGLFVLMRLLIGKRAGTRNF